MCPCVHKHLHTGVRTRSGAVRMSLITEERVSKMNHLQQHCSLIQALPLSKRADTEKHLISLTWEVLTTVANNMGGEIKLKYTFFLNLFFINLHFSVPF